MPASHTLKMKHSCQAAHRTGLVLLASLLPFFVLSGCQNLELSRQATSGTPTWATEGGSVQRSHVVKAALRPPLQEAWRYDAGAGFGPGSALLWDEVVLVGTRQGEVRAVNLETGSGEGSEEFGDAIEGTPTLHERRLYVPVAWEDAALVTYDLWRGETLWEAEGAPVNVSPLAVASRVVAAHNDGTVVAYHPTSGAQRWQDKPDTVTAIRAAPVATDASHVLVADVAGRLRMMDPQDGTRHWTRVLPTPVYATPAAHDSTVFVPTTRGQFYALDAATGATRWRLKLEDATVRFAAPAVGDSLVVVGASDGRLRALDQQTGMVRWSFEAPEALAAAPLLADSTVYVGSLGEKLYALDRRTGEHVWEQTLEGRIKSALAAHSDALVVLTEPHTVYLFQPADPRGEQYATRE